MRACLFPRASSDAVIPQPHSEIPCVQIPVESDVSDAMKDIQLDDRMSEVSEGTKQGLLAEDQEEESLVAPETDEEGTEIVSVSSVPSAEPVPSTSSAPQLANMSQTLTSIHTMVQDLKKQSNEKKVALRLEMYQLSASCSAPKKLHVKDLPPFSAVNPWRHAEHMPMSAGNIFISDKLGTLPVEDVEFWPSLGAYPDCYVRLQTEQPSKEKTAPKEVIVLDLPKAQALLTSTLKERAFTNSKVPALSKKHPSFITSSSRAFPFMEKGYKAALKAIEAGKPCPTLEECRPFSLALPSDDKDWKDVHHIFSVGKLEADIAGRQFGEDLPKLSDFHLRQEQETKERLDASMSLQTMLEMVASDSQSPDMFMVFAKAHLATVTKDLYYFIKARRACREFVFASAAVRHEPRKLISSSIWGKDLFPSEVVKEVVNKAATENRNLFQKWGLSMKRKSSQDEGPQPKRKMKRPRTPSRPPRQQQHLPAATVLQAVAQPPTHVPIGTPAVGDTVASLYPGLRKAIHYLSAKI
ncbi:uncharacterized protein [Palaemon carinicauda]|uniref:uncharacterized protein n=1 Tax=Palaemon carinicauda TaxID=392227 RepID=UPI0035B5DF05